MEGPSRGSFTETQMEMEMEMEEDVESTITLRGILEDMVYDAEDESHKIDELFSYVCAICDDGGELLCCEGRCLRSFHATKEAGEATGCKSLCFKRGCAEEMPTYLCKNCEYKQHQCYACGKLGSSDKSSGAEVFPCASAICGRFYHPYCVAKLLCQHNGKAAEELKKKISIGDYFTCPIHKCSICKEGENKTVHELQLAVCMRCPESYHRKCLPREIPFEKKGGSLGEGIIRQRAWDGLLPNRILIYCTKHAIERETGCATREHLKYPDVEEKQRRPALHSPVGREKFLAKQRTSVDLYRGRTAPTISNQEKKLSFSVDLGNAGLPSAESQKRILTMMKKAASSATLEDVIQKQNLPSTHAYSLKTFINKEIPLGKVEGSTEAVRTALRKLDEGCSTEDAEAICERNVLKQIFAWKNKLGIYIAPLLNGKRYTSFGRHFTKMDKLLEIVNRLHWYVQNGDMIVDFSCGSNDFSTLMKKKLEDTGKNCMYRNYDLFQPQNDFEFVKKDWMTVRREELLTGSQLIIGLNPPFGSSKGILANKFIDKALEFEPKILILIVPPETERLDEKSAYELIWEDDRLLSGKSFYFPGSIDVNNEQLDQWNMRAPPLYLWSHRVWSLQHKAIAVEHGHSFRT